MSLHNRAIKPVRLTRLDTITIPEGRQECRAFMVVRNELLRLPHVLDYHRALGVARFFIVDNSSTDGTERFLLRQPDCHLFTTADSYAEAWWGVDWVNHLIERHGQEHWCLVIDADELLVYPDCEDISLPALCEYLDRSGADGMFALMIDMYSRKPVSEAVYTTGSFLDVCSYFDSDYRLRRRPGLRPFPPYELIGGPRLRRFFPEFTSMSFLRLDLLRLAQFARRKVGIWGTTWAVTPPKLTKIPLMKGGRGRWLTSHVTTRLKLADMRGALLHFKYFADFHDRVVAARASGEHADSGTEYARYDKALRDDARLGLYYGGSIEYRQSTDLARFGLIADHRQFANVIEKAAAL